MDVHYWFQSVFQYCSIQLTFLLCIHIPLTQTLIPAEATDKGTAGMDDSETADLDSSTDVIESSQPSTVAPSIIRTSPSSSSSHPKVCVASLQHVISVVYV